MGRIWEIGRVLISIMIRNEVGIFSLICILSCVFRDDQEDNDVTVVCSVVNWSNQPWPCRSNCRCCFIGRVRFGSQSATGSRRRSTGPANPESALAISPLLIGPRDIAQFISSSANKPVVVLIPTSWILLISPSFFLRVYKRFTVYGLRFTIDWSVHVPRCWKIPAMEFKWRNVFNVEANVKSKGKRQRKWW